MPCTHLAYLTAVNIKNIQSETFIKAVIEAHAVQQTVAIMCICGKAYKDILNYALSVESHHTLQTMQGDSHRPAVS